MQETLARGKGEKNWNINIMGMDTGCCYMYELHLEEQDQSPTIRKLELQGTQCAPKL